MRQPRAGRILFRCITAICILIIFAVAAFVGRDVPYSEQQPLYAMLQSVSGTMFAVFGLWIALLYPDLRKKVFSIDYRNEARHSDDGNDGQDEVKSADHILQPFFVSLIVLLVTVLVDVIAPIVRRIALFGAFAETIRGLSYGLIGLLTFFQIVTILRAMRITDGLKAAISRGKSEMQIRKRIRQNHDED